MRWIGAVQNVRATRFQHAKSQIEYIPFGTMRYDKSHRLLFIRILVTDIQIEGFRSAM